jgi:hypothetical protein
MKTSPNLRWNYMILLTYSNGTRHFFVEHLQVCCIYCQMISNKILRKFLAQLHTMEHDQEFVQTTAE